MMLSRERARPYHQGAHNPQRQMLETEVRTSARTLDPGCASESPETLWKKKPVIPELHPVFWIWILSLDTTSTAKTCHITQLPHLCTCTYFPCRFLSHPSLPRVHLHSRSHWTLSLVSHRNTCHMTRRLLPWPQKTAGYSKLKFIVELLH